ncbi:MAG: hypothetical protein IPM54_37160 [Polyangiaceae bacterium]|nr:hypothetical protein [Polyangiaceae bacterium]
MSTGDHDRGREIVQAISEGLNCMANLRKLAKANEAPPPECVTELDAMEYAFQGVRQGIRDGAVETDFVADDALMTGVRAVRGLVLDWLSTGRAPPDLVPQIEEILARMGITVEYLDSEP